MGYVDVSLPGNPQKDMMPVSESDIMKMKRILKELSDLCSKRVQAVNESGMENNDPLSRFLYSSCFDLSYAISLTGK